MHTFLLLTLLLALMARSIQAQSVFAHVILGNNGAYQVSDWEADIRLAASKHIDAFVLNICPPLAGPTSDQIDLAFQALSGTNSSHNDFKLFFSFDYLGSGTPWATEDIITLLQKYGSNAGYFKYEGKPFVSTFEGPTNSDVEQWSSIRSAVSGGIYFVPDWTSQGPGYRMDLIDGAFNWNMWPDGPTNATEQQDKEWLSELQPANKTYMMGISPWFYTNLPAYNKAWVWRGDSLWYDRWQSALTLKPAFVEIVTWNDFGESHYIGPIQSSAIPQAPDADARPYVEGYPHTAWLNTLPYQIAAYKHAANSAEHPAPMVKKDHVVFWYRTSPANTTSGNSSSGVTGNACPSDINTGGYQDCYPVSEVLEDTVFAIALLREPKTVSIGIGDGKPQTFGGLKTGINFISRGFDGETGAVKVGIAGGKMTKGKAIEAAPGVVNYNAWVGCTSGHSFQSVNGTIA